jgi:formyl-CoA transferase
MAGIPRKEYDPGARGPLRGLRVIDLSRLVAGNMLTLQLADFGADVVKVEPVNGDPLRAFRTQGIEVFWKVYARNKRSVCMDFRRAETLDLLREMLAGADVLIESFRPGVLEEMGLSPAALSARNPRLVIVRISGWGQTGPYRHKPGFGTLVEGYSGFAAMNGFEDREPVLPPVFLGDMTAGLYGFGAVMTALWDIKANGGGGQVVDLSLFEPILSILGPQAANFKLTGQVKARTGSRSSTTAPRNAYRTSDGQWLCLSTSTQTMAERLFTAIGRTELINDPKFDSNRSRVANMLEVDEIVREFVGGRTLAANMVVFEKAAVTMGPIYDASNLMDDAYVNDRQSIVELQDEELGYMQMHNILPRLAETPGAFRMPAPRKGQHSREILAPYLDGPGYERLLAEGVVFSDS